MLESRLQNHSHVMGMRYACDESLVTEKNKAFCELSTGDDV